VPTDNTDFGGNFDAIFFVGIVRERLLFRDSCRNCFVVKKRERKEGGNE
jgi:hypothetical protein